MNCGAPVSVMDHVRTMYGREPDGNTLGFQEVFDWPDLAMRPRRR
jgi:hypothetical protein